METSVIIFLFIGFVMFMAARVMNERSYKHLDQEQKAKLFDLFANMRYWGIGFVVLVLALFVANLNLKIIDLQTSSMLYVGLFIVYFLFVAQRSFSILKSENYPKEYIRHYLTATVLRFMGILIMFMGLMLAG